jgi:polyhydroxybutyrate depolymerase
MMKHVLVLLLCACGAGETKSTPSALVVARPYQSNAPASYKGAPTPLVVLLHGYGQIGVTQDAYWGMTNASETHGFLLASPNGTVDSRGEHFWNATDACCDLDHTGVDDVAYVNAVIDDMARLYHVDKKRVFVTGHSNGAFMSHRLACDEASKIAAIGALAGDVWQDPSKCNPSEPVSVLQIHGDMDDEIPYGGAGPIPSAKQSVATWAQKNGCTGDLTDTGQRLDLDKSLAGAETEVDRYACAKGAAELWTIHGAGHLPDFRQPDWADALWAWLSAHPKNK